ncbi:helix-turn-helix transcriptional regulator [Streptomyces sp. B-S-A8]|uniref:Helix-turn-helix transcriptional regulator n=1 Tax=Streptomyces solicavernae TaxID=3043614 RepID=A0ABT6RUP6_9ACTN|nr:helix-turn-helix transcriptional regulator [Streptomyces sp. B-S-A8]MDI3388156.1 helix-turn-helix transcriptional regulator [Streptomyces sp. B-S-A8]
MTSTYGEWLRARREALGLTQEQVAHDAHMTRSHIAHIEAGRRIPSAEDARSLDRVLGTGDVLSSFRPQGDLGIADHFAVARKLEQQATVIREFGLSLVPGFLQTEGYVRAVMRTAFPPWSQEECDRLVVTRLDRSKLLDDPVRPVVWALLDEAVIRRPVGGPTVMAEQLMHIVRMSERERVRLHVLPLGLGAHSLMQGVLSLMWFEDQPPAAYTEGAQTGKLIDAPSAVEQLQGAYDLALGDALPRLESEVLLRSTAKDYGRHD